MPQKGTNGGLGRGLRSWASPFVILTSISFFVFASLYSLDQTYFGDGSSARDYTYVDDIVAGVRAAMARASGYSIYNLGGSALTTLRELVEMLERALDRPARLRRLPDQPGDVPITYADIGLAKRELGYAPETPIAAGIEKFCAWYLREKAAGTVS